MALSSARQIDGVDGSALNVVTFVNSSVTGSVTVSDLTLYVTPTHAILQAILDAEENRNWKDQSISQYQQTIYLCIASYVDAFRSVSGNEVDDSDIPDMLTFLEHFRESQLKPSNPKWQQIAEALTLHGTLERLYGQHLSLLELKRRDKEGQHFSTPIDISRSRQDLVGTNADGGHFGRAAALLDEALRLTKDRLDPHAAQLIILLLERSALYRDRGEYRLAAQTLQTLRTELLQHHSSEQRWIAATYKTLAVVEHESYRNASALLNFLAAEAFDVSEPDRQETKALIKDQWKRLIAYGEFKALLAMPIFLLTALLTEQLFFRVIAAGMVAATVYPYYRAYFDGLFGILVSHWIVGPFANKWPVPPPAAQILLQNAAREYRILRHNEQER